MPVTAKITVKRTSAGKRMLNALEGLKVAETHVGFPSANPKNMREPVRGEDVDVTNAQLAWIHTNEKGSPSKNIPPRPFMQESARDPKFRSNLKKLQKGLMPRVIRGAVSPKNALAAIGALMEGTIKDKILRGPWTANAPITIARKKSSRPLIDSGQLRQAVTHKEVVK